MATKDIAVNGQVFSCSLSWTVKQAKERHVRVIIVGREVAPVTCPENSNTRAVKDDLIAAYGPGLLKRGEELVLTETLSGDYEFHVTGATIAAAAAPAGMAEIPAGNKLSKFWNAVCSGGVVRNNNILSFATEGISWMIDEDIPMIYERAIYNEIFEELRDGELQKMLVHGTPGIGKSLLEFYLMYRFASHWKDGTTHSIMYKSRPQYSPRRYLFETNGTLHRVFVIADAAVYPDYYFTDTYSDIDYTPIKTKVHVTSPTESKGDDQFAQSVGLLAKRKLAIVKIMCPFTWEEAKYLLYILNQRKIKKNKPEITEEEFQFKYWVFGGSATLLSIFRVEEVGDVIQTFVETEMSDFFAGVTTEANNTSGGPLSLKEAFPATWASTCSLVASELAGVDAGFLSVNTVKQSMFQHNQGGKTVWASSFMKYLAGAIMEDHNVELFNRLGILFKKSNAEPGAVFERSAIKDILASLRDGHAYSCVHLKKGKAAKGKSWELKGKFTRKVIINDIEDIGNMKVGEVGVPNIENIVNCSLVDLVYKKASDELILFHIVYGDGDTHTGAVHSRLGDIRRRKRYGRNGKDKMIFVLTPENRAFVYQNDLEDIEQFRMDFSLSRVGNKRKRDKSRGERKQPRSSKKRKTT